MPAKCMQETAVVRSSSRRGDRLADSDDVQDAPAVRHELPVVECRAGVEDERAGCLRIVDALDRRALVGRGWIVAAREHDRHRRARRDLRRRRRRATAAGGRSRAAAAAGCVSGSPKRQLNSITRQAVRRSASARRRAHPWNGEPRRASSRRTGRWIVSRISSVSESGTSGSGENEPIPPVFGPVSPSPIALVVARRREDDRGLAGRDREDGELGSLEQFLDVERLARRGERLVELVLCPADPDAFAGGEPVELDDARQLGAVERPRVRNAGSVHHVLGERLRALDLRGGGARTEHGDAAAAQFVGETRDERRLGTDDDEVDRGTRARVRRARRDRRRARDGRSRALRCRGCRALRGGRRQRRCARATTRARARVLPIRRQAPARRDRMQRSGDGCAAVLSCRRRRRSVPRRRERARSRRGGGAARDPDRRRAGRRDDAHAGPRRGARARLLSLGGTSADGRARP